MKRVTTALLVCAAACVAAAIWWARQSYLDAQILHVPPHEQTLPAVHMWAGLAIFALSLLVLVVVRRERPLAALAAAFALIGAASIAYGGALASLSSRDVPELREELRLLHDHIDVATWLAVFPIVLAGGWSMREPRRAPSLRSGILVLALGAAAFVCTRGHAHDAETLPRIAARQVHPDFRQLPNDALPVAGQCDPIPECPTISIAEGILLDGRRVSGANLASDLDTIHRNYRILGNHPCLNLELDRHAPDTRAAVLAIAARAGYRDVHQLVVRPRRAHTATLRDRLVYDECTIRLPLSRSG